MNARSRLMHIAREGRILLVAGFALTVLVGLLCLVRPVFMQHLDYSVYDVLLRTTTSPGVTSGVPVLVDLDEKSLREYGQWPWPRYRVALLLAKLQAMGVRAVGLDILFAEPDNASPATIQEQLRNDLNISIQFDDIPPEFRDTDMLLAQTLAQGPFVLGYNFYTTSPGEGESNTSAALPAHPLPHAFITPPGVQPELSYIESPNAAALNLSVLREAATASGFFTTGMDSDGVVRRIPLLMRYKEKLYPSLALATLLRSQKANATTMILRMDENGVDSLQLGGRQIPLDARGRLLIKYRGPGRTFPFISAADVLADRVGPEELRGKVAIVGSSASGLMDIRATPLDPVFPGMEAHATVIDNIIAQDYLWQPSWHTGAELVMVLLAGILFTVLLSVTRALYTAIPAVLLSLALVWGSIYAMEQGVFISPLYPLVLMAALFTVLTLLRYWREEHRKRFFQTAFASYVSPRVVDQIIRSPEKLSLTGEEKEVSVLFTDLRGFTSLSESLEPEQLSGLLNAYFTPMTRILTDRMGTLDKFIGDAIMAFWNAPLDVPDHQTQALLAAMEMVEELEALNEELQRRYGATLRLGAGIHTGRVRVGNMGTDTLFNYTVMGDAVNLASRLEGLTKYYETPILVSGEAARTITDIELIEVDTVRVKGKERAVTLYVPEKTTGFSDHVELFVHGLDLYKSRRFGKAAALFRDLYSQTGHRIPAIYAERSLVLAGNPPEESWDMVYEHKTK